MKIIPLLVLCLFMIGCGSCATDTTSGCKLLIMDLTDANGVNILTSDVLTNGSVYDDKGALSVSVTTWDPVPLIGVNPNLDVTVDQVDIEYSRSDGKNVAGKDVPYPFSQPVTVYVAFTEKVTFSIVLIRHIAKLEPPLIDLVDSGQENILYLNAKVTVHGVDGAGKRVKPVVGYIQIQCANFGDQG